MRQNFRAPWDWKLITITGVMVLILGWLLLWRADTIMTLIVLAIIVGCSIFGIYGYSIQEGRVKIIRLGWAKEIEIKDIANVSAAPHAMIGSIRMFGIGGFLGYIGYYRNSILGSYRAYATNSGNTVLIETKDGHKFVLTPDDPDEFIETLNARLRNIAD